MKKTSLVLLLLPLLPASTLGASYETCPAPVLVRLERLRVLVAPVDALTPMREASEEETSLWSSEVTMHLPPPSGDFSSLLGEGGRIESEEVVK